MDDLQRWRLLADMCKPIIIDQRSRSCCLVGVLVFQGFGDRLGFVIGCQRISDDPLDDKEVCVHG